jgi:xylan 1,4-beta-xylosidase
MYLTTKKAYSVFSLLPYLAAFAVLAVSSRGGISQAQSVSKGKTYRNPILDDNSMADPHILNVDGKYYMYPTSHGHGFDVYVSDDLVQWRNQGTVFNDPRGGAWAPDVFHSRDGRCFLYYTDDMPDKHEFLDKQIGVAVADSPLGPFVDRRVLATNSIDAHLFEDTDEKLYLYYVHLREGFRILVQPMADPLTPTGRPTELIRPTEPWERASGDVTEGPFVVKRNDTYYLTYSGTGADSPNYGIGYATSKSPTGPFTKFADNPIVKRTADIHGPGHHSMVNGPRGDLWMVYHQKRNAEINFDRFLAIDLVWFDEDGVLHAKVTKGTDEPAP